VPSARRRVFWTFANRAQLRQVGDVTGVLSRRRRNDGPKHTKLLVTNLPQATAQVTVACYLRRWPVELGIKELKGVVGLGQPQVTKAAARVERSVAGALMAYGRLVASGGEKNYPGHARGAAAPQKRAPWGGGARREPRAGAPATGREEDV